MAATMSSELTDTDQLKLFYEDALANGITFLPPDINESDYLFTPTANAISATRWVQSKAWAKARYKASLKHGRTAASATCSIFVNGWAKNT